MPGCAPGGRLDAVLVNMRDDLGLANKRCRHIEDARRNVWHDSQGHVTRDNRVIGVLAGVVTMRVRIGETPCQFAPVIRESGSNMLCPVVRRIEKLSCAKCVRTAETGLPLRVSVLPSIIMFNPSEDGLVV